MSQEESSEVEKVGLVDELLDLGGLEMRGLELLSSTESSAERAGDT